MHLYLILVQEGGIHAYKSHIDATYRNDSRCSRYSCTTEGTGDTAVLQEGQEIQLYLILVQEQGIHVYKTHRRILQEWQQIQQTQLYYRRYRGYSCTGIWYRNRGMHVYKHTRRILQEWQKMQEVQLYYRRYRRYSCTTGGAGDAAVPNFSTGTGVFTCLRPIDIYYRNDSRCSRYCELLIYEMYERQICVFMICRCNGYVQFNNFGNFY